MNHDLLECELLARLGHALLLEVLGHKADDVLEHVAHVFGLEWRETAFDKRVNEHVSVERRCFGHCAARRHFRCIVATRVLCLFLFFVYMFREDTCRCIAKKRVVSALMNYGSFGTRQSLELTVLGIRCTRD